MAGRKSILVLVLIALLFATPSTQKAKKSDGSKRERRGVVDIEDGDNRLQKGNWFIMAHDDDACTNCTELRAILSAVSSRYSKHGIKFGAVQLPAAARYGVAKNAPHGVLALLPGKGQEMFAPYKDGQTEKEIEAHLSHFLAEKAMEVGKNDAALGHLDHALKQSPGKPLVNYYAATILHQHKRDLQGAVRHYEAALAGEAELPDPARVNYMAGNAYLTLGYPDRATQCYNRATQHDASLHSAHRESAIAFGLQGKLESASKQLRAALAINPTDPDSLTELAAIILGSVIEMREAPAGRKKKTGKGKKKSAASLEEAERLLRSAVRSHAQHAEAWWNLGTALKIKGNLEEAQQAFMRAVKIRDASIPGDQRGSRSAGSRAEALAGGLMGSGAANLTVYVYDLHPKWNSQLLSLNMEQCRYSIYAAEVHIHEQMLLSPHLTLDPAKADLFLVPFYSSCYMSSNFVKPGPGWPDNDVDIAYWHAKNGFDHVWTFTSDWGSCLGPFAELHNSIHIVTSGDRSENRPQWYQPRASDHMGSSDAFAERSKLPCFQAHKDIVLPPMLAVPALFRDARAQGSSQKDISVYFRGAAVGSEKAGQWAAGYSSGSRQTILSNFSGQDGWVISGDNRPDLYHSELARSRMCLAPPGWELWSVRFYESLLLGCVPVILSDGLHLPFETLLDYSSMTIKVLEADLARLPALLNSVSRERIESKRAAAQRHWKAVTFQRPPEAGDAFDLLLGELSSRTSRKGATPGGGWL